MFGVNSAPEVFQSAVEQMLSGLHGCKNMADDIVVYGRTQEEHDKNLRAVLDRLREYGATLNKDKCRFAQNQVKYYGQIFTDQGYKADPKKISDVKNAPTPTTAGEVRSFLGMAQYLARYIPYNASMTKPLHELIHKDAKWKWGEDEQSSFTRLKDALTIQEVMTYFDPNKQTKIFVDASPVGLSAILTQDGKILAYGSRALKDVETRYSQTEREMLAVLWGAEHYHVYVFGKDFQIITDHKPLLGIFRSQRPMSARIEGWRLRLMPYDCQLVYQPGVDNPADFLSRHPQHRAPENLAAEQHVNYIFRNAVPKAMTETEITEACKNDEVIQQLKKAIQSGDETQWKDPLIQDYLNVRNELTVVADVVLRDNRIVMPSELQQKAIDLAHSGHQGVDKIFDPGEDLVSRH